jgi:signal transduction histidine kinase
MTLGDQSKTDFTLESNLEFFRFDEKKELALFRIAQESINNILKYSKASEASVKLVLVENILLMQIEDNGCGFDISAEEHQKGIGLDSIRTRAKAISAKLEIFSEIDEGTSIRVVTEVKIKNDGKD